MLSTPFPLPSVPFTLFTTAKTAKYIIRPLIPVMLTHPSSPLPPYLFQYCSSSLPLASPLRPAGMAAELLWSARVYPFGLRCGCAWCEVVRGFFFTTPLNGPNVKVFQALKSNQDFHSRCSGGSHRRWDAPPQKVVVIAGARTVCASVRFALCIFVTSIATWCWRSVVLKLKKVLFS